MLTLSAVKLKLPTLPTSDVTVVSAIKVSPEAPSNTPLLFADDIKPGTHITAVGSDTSTKQELDSKLLSKADLVIADSISQSKSRGEIFRAIEDGAINFASIVELGYAIQNKEYRRTSEEQISIVDLTGVAVQDIMIATSVYKNYLNLQS